MTQTLLEIDRKKTETNHEWTNLPWVISDVKTKSSNVINEVIVRFLDNKFEKLADELSEDWSNFELLISSILNDLILNHQELVNNECSQSIDDIIDIFINSYFKNIYRSKKYIPQNLKYVFENNSFLKTCKTRYIEEKLKVILKDKSINTYDEMWYLLYLIGTKDDYEVLSDIRNDELKKLGELLINISWDIKELKWELNHINATEEEIELFNYKIECFYLLSETINKIALDKITDDENILFVRDITTFLYAQFNDIIPRLESSKCNKIILKKILFLKWKLITNFTYKTGILNGETKEIIDKQALELEAQTKDWLRIQKESEFWGNSSIEDSQTQMWEVNIGLLQLRKAKRYEECKIEWADLEMKKWFDYIISVYNIENNLNLKNPEDVINNIMDSGIINATNLWLEVTEYFLHYHKFEKKLLIDFLTYLTWSWIVFENTLIEKLKINIIEQIILSLQPKPWLLRSINIDQEAEMAINQAVNYIKWNSNLHLILSYSKIYLAASLFYSCHFSDNYRLKAAQYFHLFWAIYWKDTELFKKAGKTFLTNIWKWLSNRGNIKKTENDFLDDWANKYWDLEEIANEKLKNNVSYEILNLITTKEWKINNHSVEDSLNIFCRTIEKYIFNYNCKIRIIKTCSDCPNEARECITCPKNFKRWWYWIDTIALPLWYIVIFEFSNNWKNNFYDIFNDEKKDFIKQNLWNLLEMVLKKEQDDEKNQELANAYKQLELHVKKLEENNAKIEEQKALLERDFTTWLQILHKLREKLDGNNEAKSLALLCFQSFLDSQSSFENIEYILIKIWEKFKKKFSDSCINIYVDRYDFYILFDSPIEYSVFKQYIDVIDNVLNEIRIENNKENIISYKMWFVQNESIDLIKKAKIALLELKETWDEIQTYSIEIESRQKNKMKLTNYISKALENWLFYPVYQPKFNSEWFLSWVEVLARINDKNWYPIPAENNDWTGFIQLMREKWELWKLTKKLLPVMCKDVTRFLSILESNKISLPHFNFAVNLTNQDFNSNLGENILDILEKNNLTPDRLILEITENIWPVELRKGKDFLIYLKNKWCKIVLDDFWINLANPMWILNFFNELGFWPDNVKIDKSQLMEERTLIWTLKYLREDCSLIPGKDFEYTVEWVEKNNLLLTKHLNVSVQWFWTLPNWKWKPLLMDELIELAKSGELNESIYWK